MVLHQFQTRYSIMFEIEMRKLKLNQLSFKISRIMDFKNHVEITYERTLDKNVLLDIFGSRS